MLGVRYTGTAGAGPRSIGRTPRPGAAVTSKSPDAPDVAMLYVEAVMEVRPRHSSHGASDYRCAFDNSVMYAEPSQRHDPPRLALDAMLLQAGSAAEAESVSWDDLNHNRENGCGLFGLVQSLQPQGKPWTRSRSTSDSRTPGPCGRHLAGLTFFGRRRQVK